MSIPYIVTSESITVVVKGKPYTVSVSNAAFAEIKNRLANQDFAGIEQLFNTGAAIGSFTKGNITVEDNGVLFRGVPIHNLVVDRILDFMRQGLPYQPLVNFLDKLMQNPSARAVAELYTFLEHKNMPLTPEGNFLSYKGVDNNFYSVHAGKLTLLKGTSAGASNTGCIYNAVGQEVECPRNEVCDNFKSHCSPGLHIGSLEYAKGWGSQVVIVEVNPADVVCVPDDCSCQKMRCHHYKVVATYERPLDEALNADYSEPMPEVMEDDIVPEHDDANYEIDYGTGYALGYEDAQDGFARNSDYAMEDLGDKELNEDAFEDGYHAGYDASISENPPAPRKQLRDANGRFM